MSLLSSSTRHHWQLDPGLLPAARRPGVPVDLPCPGPLLLLHHLAHYHCHHLSPSPSRSPSSPSTPGPEPAHPARAEGPEYDVQWYARHAPASLFDVCATVRTLCLGGVQVGAVRAADVGKLTEYLRSHPPVPRGAGWGAREYVLELLELLRPFKLLRADLQGLGPGGRTRRGPSMPSGGGSVRVEDLLPELREVGRVTQESIFNDDFRPCVKVYS